MILNHNGIEWLRPLYRSLVADDYPDSRIYLVDNASEDGSIEMTLREHPEMTVLSLPRNLGYCMAYNLTMPCALADGCEWLIWMNSDVLVEPGCLLNLMKACMGNGDIGVAGPAFLSWQGSEPNAYMKGNHPDAIPAMRAGSSKPIDVDWVEGSLLMVSRDCLNRTGSLDPFLFAYWEEADFCRRVRFGGQRVVLVPNAVARHFGGGAWNRAYLQGERRRLLTRNQYIYHLAEPARGFGRNFLSCLRHYGVCAKAALPSLPELWRETRFYARALREIGAIHQKWARDRAGNPPPAVTGEHEGIAPRILRGGKANAGQAE